MSIFHCSAKAISRAAGRSATAIAAYRAGECIIDERTGEAYDYRRKKGVFAHRFSCLRVFAFHPVPLCGIWSKPPRAQEGRTIIERYGVTVDMRIHAPGKKGGDRKL